jgi:hypothetical protein
MSARSDGHRGGGVRYASSPPCPRLAISQPVTRYRASSGGKTRSTTFGLADRKHPGAETTGISSLYPQQQQIPWLDGSEEALYVAARP